MSSAPDTCPRLMLLTDDSPLGLSNKWCPQSSQERLGILGTNFAEVRREDLLQMAAAEAGSGLPLREGDPGEEGGRDHASQWKRG